MEDRRRTRSQGLLEGVQLIQWDSLQDPVRIEREQAEACRRVREVNTVTNINEGAVENSEISQLTEEQPGLTVGVPQLGEISQTSRDKKVKRTSRPNQNLAKKKRRKQPTAGNREQEQDPTKGTR